MSFLENAARARNVTNIASASILDRVAIFRDTVGALDRVLDGNQRKFTLTSLTIITDDLTRIIEGIRVIEASYFQTRDAVLFNLREARRRLFDAQSMIDAGQRPNLTFFGRLNEARALLEAASREF